jgi:hypothetical protein
VKTRQRPREGEFGHTKGTPCRILATPFLLHPAQKFPSSIYPHLFSVGNKKTDAGIPRRDEPSTPSPLFSIRSKSLSQIRPSTCVCLRGNGFTLTNDFKDARARQGQLPSDSASRKSFPAQPGHFSAVRFECWRAAQSNTLCPYSLSSPSGPSSWLPRCVRNAARILIRTRQRSSAIPE